MRRILTFGTGLALAASLVAPSATALAAAPSNDNFASATTVSPFPFTDSVDVTQATLEAGEPTPCAPSSHTVWYSFTPSSDGAVTVDPFGSTFFDTILGAYSASSPSFAGLTILGCQAFGSALVFTVHAGTTYYVQASDYFTGGGTLNVSFTFTPPPPNDNFANATAFATVPYSDTTNFLGATSEPNEPSCGYGLPGGTDWYAFTPLSAGSVTASASGSNFSTFIAAYTGGPDFASLTQLGCHQSSVLTIQVSPGTTYYFQAASAVSGGATFGMTFQLVMTPPPVADFGWSPTNPSSFDTVNFFDGSSDPGQVGFDPAHWQFGDGTSAVGTVVQHRYSKDGDYIVTLTATTTDGRTATGSHLVSVRTHDIAITKFTVPTSARSGQTRQITVGISDHHYPEPVIVQVFKSSPTGYQIIGEIGRTVRVSGGNRTDDFVFNYTFTADDAAIGKVTFRAIAGINVSGIADALPADNEAISAPTKVGK